MKQALILLSAVMLLISACSNTGNKVYINKNNIVYYRGKGITEADAKKLGNFLFEHDALDSNKKEVVQLSKEESEYVVSFVLDKNTYERDKDFLKPAYSIMGAWISLQVFNGAKIKIEFTDNLFNCYAHINENTGLKDELKDILRRNDSTSTLLKANSLTSDAKR